MISRVPQFEQGPAPDILIVSGYIADFKTEERVTKTDDEGWTERFTRKAFLHAMSGNPDLCLLFNQAGSPLARTKDGSMTIVVDDVGVKVRAIVHIRLDEDRFHLNDHPGEPEYSRGCYFCEEKKQTKQLLTARELAAQADAEKHVMLGFAYQVTDEEWSNNYHYRLITKLSMKTVSIDIREAF